INDLVAGGVPTAEAIAAELGIAADRAQAVLTAMCSLGLLTREEQDYRNTPTGAVLTGEGAADRIDLSSPALLDLFSLVDLIDVLPGRFAARTSRASPASLALAGDVDVEAAAALTRRAPDSGRTIHTPAAQALAGGEDWPSVDCTLVIAGLTGRSRDAVGSLLDRMLAASRTLVIVEP